MKIEKINDAKMAVRMFSDRKLSEKQKLVDILDKWQDIISGHEECVFYVGQHKGYRYYLENDKNLWWLNSEKEYDRDGTAKSGLDFPLRIIAKFRKRIESIIEELPDILNREMSSCD